MTNNDIDRNWCETRNLKFYLIRFIFICFIYLLCQEYYWLSHTFFVEKIIS